MFPLLAQQTEVRSIGSIIRRRTCDEKVGVRKAALQVRHLSSIMHVQARAVIKFEATKTDEESPVTSHIKFIVFSQLST